MLSAATASRRALSLERLDATAPRRRPEDLDWETRIDRSRLFFCETLTPLYYTKSYGELAPEHRLRYNQLTGILSNELILRLETQFLDRALDAVTRHGGVGSELAGAVRRFRDDEQRHAALWRRLNQLSEPEWYGNGGSLDAPSAFAFGFGETRRRRLDPPARLVRIPPLLDGLARVLVRHPAACPLIFWMQLIQEERSVEISRRCLRMPVGALEPRYAAVYGEHLRDEVRHVQVDCHLIERFHSAQSLAARRMTAAAFRWITSNLFLQPSRSSVRVLEVLTSEYRELRPLLPRMVRELRALVTDDAYNQMMYSRQTTPLTFAMFDAFPEFHSMSRVLRAYTPVSAARLR